MSRGVFVRWWPLLPAALVLVGCAAPATPQADLVLANARVIDGTGVVKSRVHIVIEEGRIARLSDALSPPQAENLVEVSGMTVIPGLMDVHQHLFAHLDVESPAALAAYIETDLPEQLAQYLAYGVTTIQSTGDYGEAILGVRDRLAQGALTGPRLYVVGPVFTAPGGHPAGTVCAGEQWCRDHFTVEVDEAEAAVAAVELWATQGVDAIKLVYDGFDGGLELPKLDRAVMEAIVEAARSRGLRVTAHTSRLEDAIAVARAGASSLEHGVLDRPVDRTFLELLKNQGVTYVPTLSAVTMATRSPGNSVETARTNFRLLLEAGIRMAAGSDFSPPGLATLAEMHRMVECGATPMQALMAGTRDAAAHLGILENLGTIEEGKIADLVVVDGNPLEEFDAIENIVMTIVEGRIVVDRRGPRRTK